MIKVELHSHSPTKLFSLPEFLLQTVTTKHFPSSHSLDGNVETTIVVISNISSYVILDDRQ